MKNQILEGVNVAPSSTSGHYVKKAINVVNLDQVKETFFVHGASELETKNHTTLVQDTSCLITTQIVYNPFSKMFERSRD
jgi:predicted nucleic acid-binding protein